jgi:predicted amidohydrolase
MTDARSLKIGAVQFELRAEPSLDAYLEHVDRVVSSATSQGSELVLLPELASTGLLGAIQDHNVTVASVTDDYWKFLAPMWDGILAGIKEISARHHVVLLGGSHNRIHDDGSLRNTAALVWPSGRVLLQDKLHLTPQEHAMGMTGGDDLPVGKVGPFTVGVLICADIQFPELARYLVAKSVDLILCPSLTWNRRGVFRVHTGCGARAIENQLYVAMSPLVGASGLPEGGPLHAVGKALVSGPVDKTFGNNDGLVDYSQDTGEGVLISELDHDLLLVSRETPEAPGLKLQRPDLYDRLRAESGSS